MLRVLELHTHKASLSLGSSGVIPILGLLGIFLCACGDQESPDPASSSEIDHSDGTRVTAPASPSERTGNAVPDRYVNALTFDASGDAEGSLQSDGADLMVAGGCDENGYIRMSLTRGNLADKDLFQVRLETEENVGPHATGTFALSKVGWYNGQVAPANLPTKANILVPDSYEGTGSLTLTTHDSSPGEWRMIGTIEGVVDQDVGDKTATITASFDVNLACSP